MQAGGQHVVEEGHHRFGVGALLGDGAGRPEWPAARASGRGRAGPDRAAAARGRSRRRPAWRGRSARRCGTPRHHRLPPPPEAWTAGDGRPRRARARSAHLADVPRREQEAGHGLPRDVHRGSPGAVDVAGRDALVGHPLDLVEERVAGADVAERRRRGIGERRLVAEPVDEGRHRLARHGRRRTERVVAVATCDLRVVHPLDLEEERVRRGHVREGGLGGGLEGVARQAVEEGGHGRPGDARRRSEGAVLVAGGDLGVVHPRDTRRRTGCRRPRRRTGSAPRPRRSRSPCPAAGRPGAGRARRRRTPRRPRWERRRPPRPGRNRPRRGGGASGCARRWRRAVRGRRRRWRRRSPP